MFLCSSLARCLRFRSRSRRIQKNRNGDWELWIKKPSLIGADLSSVLRSALVKELRSMPLFGCMRIAQRQRPVVGLQHRRQRHAACKASESAGDLEVSADVSLIISVLPGRRVIGMVSGGATVIGSSTVDTHFMTLLVQNLQQEAITQSSARSGGKLVESLSRQQGGKSQAGGDAPAAVALFVGGDPRIDVAPFSDKNWRCASIFGQRGEGNVFKVNEHLLRSNHRRAAL